MSAAKEAAPMADRLRCSYCPSRDTLTRDHIIPRRTGATWHLPCGARNWRWACLHCNQMRDHVGDCPAVVAMVKSVARDARVSDRVVLAAWGFIHKKKRGRASARLVAFALARRARETQHV